MKKIFRWFLYRYTTRSLADLLTLLKKEKNLTVIIQPALHVDYGLFDLLSGSMSMERKYVLEVTVQKGNSRFMYKEEMTISFINTIGTGGNNESLLLLYAQEYKKEISKDFPGTNVCIVGEHCEEIPVQETGLTVN